MDDTKKALLSIDIDTAALTQNVNNAKAAVADLKSQLDNLKAAGKDSGDAFDKLSEQLKKAGDEAKKSNDALKEHTRGLSDSTTATINLKSGLIDLSKQHNNLQGDTAKSTKSVSDYTNSFLKAVESVTPFGKSISETAEKFKTLQEGAGKVGSALGLLKKDGDNAATNAQTLSTNAGKATKGFEALTTGTEAASSGVGTFTKALAGTGIGLIIIAVALLIDYLKKFQPIVDFTERVMAGFNGALAAGKHILDEFFGSISSVGDLVSKLGNFLAHPIDSLRNLGSAMAEAAKKSYDLKKAQQDLDEQVLASAAKTSQNQAKIAELTAQAQTASLSKRKDLQKQIADLQDKETAEHRKNAEEQVRITVNKVAAENNLTAIEIGDIKKLDEAKIEALEKSRHLDSETVKSLREAVQQMDDLRKQASEKQIKANEEKNTALKAAQQKHNQEMDATQASRDRMKIAAQHDELQKELAEIEINFAQQQKQYKGQTAVLVQLAKERDQQLADIKQKFKDEVEKRDAAAANELAHLRFEKEIKDAEGNYDQIKIIKLNQLAIDKAFELSNANLTANEKLLIEERFNQKKFEINKEAKDAQYREDKQEQQKAFDALLEQDQKEIVQNDKNDKLKLQAQLKYLKDKHDADIFNAGTDAKLKSKINEQYFADKQKLDAEYLKSTQKTFQGELKLIDQKAQHYQQHFSKLSGLFAKNTQVSKAAFAAQKAIATAEIAINTEKQVSASISATKNQIAEDSKLSFPLGTILVVKDIVLGAIDVASTIANGAKQVATINGTNPPGFARGGMYLSDGYGAYLTGPGTGTSDSINAKLSNGESVINARSTEMFAPILSAINMAGGGRAFSTTTQGNGYALGGLFNGSNTLNDGSNDLAVTRATNDMLKTMATNMPRQILVVEDVQASLQNKVMLQNMSNF